MCAECRRGDYIRLMLSDPLVRLMMASDGVSEAELLSTWTSARRAIELRRTFALSRSQPGRPDPINREQFRKRCS
jgi:hypothetical protein